LTALTRLNVSLSFGGVPRFFLLTLPSGFDDAAPQAEPLPLLVALHGAGSSAALFLDGGLSPWYGSTDPATPFDAAGTASGFVVAVPQAAWGSGANGAPPRRWRGASERRDPISALEAAESSAAALTAGGAAAAPYDDVAFVWALAACVRDGLRVRLSGAVHAAGWSQGGKLASALACAPPPAAASAAGFFLAAVAAGAGLTACDDAMSSAPVPVPVPLLVLQGGADSFVPFCSDGAVYRSGQSALAAWAAPRRNGCDAERGWRALCAGGRGGDALRVYVPLRACAAAPLALYWLPSAPHMMQASLPGLPGGTAELFVAFFASVAAGVPNMTPLGGPFAACEGLPADTSAGACALDEAPAPPWAAWASR
jgi:poly(3-hydroxybutyrate) depolymerase